MILKFVQNEVEFKINKGLKELGKNELKELALGLSALAKLMSSLKED